MGSRELLTDVTVNGMTVRIEHIIDNDGGHAIELSGVNCRLTGEMPGLYYPEPLDEEEWITIGGPSLEERRADRRRQQAPERIAQRFHEVYEELAPSHGWQAQERSRVPWEQVPPENRRLMIEVVTRLLHDGAISAP